MSEPRGNDKRLWAKIDLGYLSNLKMSEVLDASSSAPLMHLASILHCAQHLTDGHASPKAMQRAVGGSDTDIDLLVTAGLWHRPGHDCDECPQPSEGRIYVHNYLDHNVSSGKMEKLSQRGKKAADARWAKEKADATSNATSMQNASKAHATSNASRMHNAMPDKIRLDQIDISAADASNDTDEAFDNWYQKYPKKVSKGQARKAFKAAIKKTDLETLIAARDSYAKSVHGKDKTFIANPATWLNGERWEDEPTSPPTQSPEVDDRIPLAYRMFN